MKQSPSAESVTFHKPRRFVIVFTTALHLSLSQDRQIKLTPLDIFRLRSSLILSTIYI
jgi:hypothetical protein